MGAAEPVEVAQLRKRKEGDLKSAIYLNSGTTQLVLTPENKWERSILRMLHDSLQPQTYWGTFYECQGGWYRQGVSTSGYTNEPVDDVSLIFRLEKQAEIPEQSK